MFQHGDKVTYAPDHLADKPLSWEHGIVKGPTPHGDGLIVVYNCAGNWENYEDYSGMATNMRDLIPGWADKEVYDVLRPRGKSIKTT